MADLQELLEGVAPGAVATLRELLRSEGPLTGWAEGDRRFVRAGGLFVTASVAARDVAPFAAEVAARRRLPTTGPLRAPAVLAAGPGWYVSRAVTPVPLEQVDPELVVDAVAAIALLPTVAAAAATSRSPRGRFGQQVRLLASPVPLRDVRRARAVRRTAPRVHCAHNDLHPGNVLATPDALYVIDWEYAGPGVAGGDLARLAALLPLAHASRLLDAAARRPGCPSRRQLERLRYAAVVRSAADLWLADDDQGRDPVRAAELVALLPALRAAAGL